MQSPWINRLGDWNPQLLRELRGRLKPRNVIAAISLSAIAQVLLLLVISQQLTQPPEQRWLQVWRAMTWVFPYFLFTVGSYYLVNDVSQEERRGTLNFIRLSPRPAWEILLGKLLGVPVLPVLMVLVSIPVHLMAAIGAGVPVLMVLSVYLILVAACGLCFSGALLFGLVGGTQLGFANRQATIPISFAAIAFLFLSPLYMGWNLLVTWRPFPATEDVFRGRADLLHWFYLPINAQSWVSHGFTLTVIATATYLTWRILLRRFRQPRSTSLSKRQSYALLSYAEVLALGFWLQPNLDSELQVFGAVMMYLLTYFLILLMMFAIAPQRQGLLDWVRYQSQGWQSWVWADKSPSILAIGIQMAIASALLVPWIVLTGISKEAPLSTFLIVVSGLSGLLLYGLFVQSVFAAKIRNPAVWAIGGLVVWSSVPPMILGLLQLTPDKAPATAALWTFFGYPFWHYDDQRTLPFTVIGIVLQWVAIAFLGWQFQKTLRRLRTGHSQESPAGTV